MSRLTNASYVKIGVAVVLGIMLFALAGFGSCVVSGGDHGKATHDMIGNASVPAREINNIDIDWAAGSVDVIVSETDSDEIRVVEYTQGSITKASSMRWSVAGDTLRIDYGGWMSCVSLGSKNLEVHIPESLAAKFGRLDIDGASGHYRVGDLVCEELRVSLSSGRFDAGDIDAATLDIELASGTVAVGGRFAESVRVQVASGKADISCKGVCPNSVDADMASGDVTLSIPENEGFTAKVDKASGSFRSGFDTSSQDDGIYVHKSGKARFIIDIASGSFALEKSSER